MKCPRCHKTIPAAVRWCQDCRVWLDDGVSLLDEFMFVASKLSFHSPYDAITCSEKIALFLKGESTLLGFGGAASDLGFRLAPATRFSGKPLVTAQIMSAPPGSDLRVRVVPNPYATIGILLILLTVLIIILFVGKPLSAVILVPVILLGGLMVFFLKKAAISDAKTTLTRVLDASEIPAA
jgi:hypothetical protein